MRALGALLVLAGAACCCLRRRRAGQLPIRVGRAVAADLAVLRYEICRRRAPLPQILEESLDRGAAAQWLWSPLERLLREDGERDLPQCWTAALEGLPEPLRRSLAPLGPLLPQGGRQLEEAIEEARSELGRFLREETARQADSSRVAAALCLAGACLTILVLL